MLTNIILIVIGLVFAGAMFYSFFMVLFSKKDYKNIPKPIDKNASGSANSKRNGKIVGQS
jgi:flagellar basal body-associated protein FliL